MHRPLRSPLMCGLMVLPAFVLLAAVALTGHTPVAQAATPVGVDARLVANRVHSNKTVCVGDQVKIQLGLEQHMTVNGQTVLGRHSGAVIEVTLLGNGLVGHVLPPSSSTSFERLTFPSALFVFNAERPGSIVLRFTTVVTRDTFLGLAIASDTLAVDVPITVSDCKYQVSATSHWEVPGEADIRLVARIQFAGLVEDQSGKLRGTAAVQWVASAAPVGDCRAKVPPDSTAELVAEIFEDPDQFIVTIVYDTATIPIAISCAGLGETRNVKITPDPLAFTVSAEDGEDILQHVLRGPEDSTGTAVVIVRTAPSE